jgi:hypothetical protein
MVRVPEMLFCPFLAGFALEVHLIPGALGYRIASMAETAAAA